VNALPDSIRGVAWTRHQRYRDDCGASP
jgi:hypothetical protein